MCYHCHAYQCPSNSCPPACVLGTSQVSGAPWGVMNRLFAAIAVFFVGITLCILVFQTGGGPFVIGLGTGLLCSYVYVSLRDKS